MFTIEYLIFLAVITCLYYTVPQRLQRYLLFISSLLFLGNISVTFLFFALTFSVFNLLLGILIEKQKIRSRKKILYFSALLTDIGILFFFKYSKFIIEIIYLVSDLFTSSEEIPYLSIILPVGISYYAFQNIGYIHRVYKGIEVAEKSFIIFTIYNLFFPKLLSGPIETSNHFLPQLHSKTAFNKENISKGLQLILFGFLKKLVVAENMGVPLTYVHSNLNEYSGFTLVLVLLLQPLYMYFDFSGYTDIAIGSARLFGYRLTDNFKRPFFAHNISVFWRRWHISLTRWCNDFIYTAILYKKRKWKVWGAVYAVLITFLIIGFWHGPNWNFIILGLLQGIAISFEFLTKKYRYKFFRQFNVSFSKNLGRIITYLFFSFSLLFFFLPEFSDVLMFIGNIFEHPRATIEWELFIEKKSIIIVVLFMILCFLTVEGLHENNFPVLDKFNNLHFFYRYALYYIIIYIIIWYGGIQHEFIYFHF